MCERFNKPTALRTLPKTIEASVYNHVRSVLRRLACPLRIDVSEHRGLEMILDEDIWLCVDAGAGDQPVMVRSSFVVRGRGGLQAPVPCRLELYHRFAGAVTGSVLDTLDDALAAKFRRLSV